MLFSSFHIDSSASGPLAHHLAPPSPFCNAVFAFPARVSYHEAMLGIDRRAARYTWTAAVVLLLLMGLYLVRKTVIVFIIALLLAYLLSPLVEFLDRMLPTSRTRTPALVAVYLLLIGVLVFLGFEIGTRVVEEANALMERLKATQSNQTSMQPGSIVATIMGNIQNQIRQHSSDIIAFLPKMGIQALSIAGNLILVVIVPILSFFFLKDGRVMGRTILDFFDEGPRRNLIEDIAKDVNLLLIRYMRALLILSLASMTSFSIVLSLMGVPYALLLSAIAGLLEFIPVVGPFAAAILILLVSGFSGYPHLLWILLFLGVYRLFQDYVLSPRLMSSGMQLHPLMVIFGVFAGGEIGGIAGTFFSVPVLALARVLYRRLEKARRETEFTKVSP